MCTCDQRVSLRRTLKRFDFPWTRTQGITEGRSASVGRGSNSSAIPPDFSLSREEIARLNPGDMLFFRAAVREFERRVAIVEDRVGHRFLHCSEEAESPAPPPLPQQQHRSGREARLKKD